MLTDPPKTILKKFKKAVTDSEATIRYDEEAQPGVANLINIWCAATGNDVAAALKHFDYNMYGKLKVETAEAVNVILEPVQERYRTIMEDRGELSRILDAGAVKARERAETMMVKVADALGLPPRNV